MSVSTKYFQPEVLSAISRLDLRARHVVEGFVSGMHRSPYKGISVEFASHRSYVPGDDIRHIDWRVYGKADRFYIKEFEEETNLRTHLILDCSGSMGYPEHPGTNRMTKWDYAATLAASLAHLLVYQQDGVGLTIFDTSIRRQLPVSSSRAQLPTLSSVIESHAPGGSTDVKSLTEVAANIPRRGMVVLLSDLLMDIDDLTAALHRFRFDRHDVVVLHVMDHDELEFPFVDRTLFEGMEEVDLEVLTDPQALRQSYLDAVGAFTKRIRRVCLQAKIDYALISTAEGVDVALTTFLAARMNRQRARA